MNIYSRHQFWFSILSHLFASCYVQLCCVSKRRFTRISQMFLLGLFFSLGKQGMNFGWIHFHPSLHTVSPMVRNNSLFPSSIQDWTQKGEGKEWIFLGACLHVLLIGPGTYRSTNLESRKTFLLVSSSFWVWGTERSKLIFLFMQHGSPAAGIWAFFKCYFFFQHFDLLYLHTGKSGGLVCSVVFWELRHFVWLMCS